MTLLITGILFSSISGAVISLLAYFSSAERLREFVFWSYGSTHLMNTYELFLLALSCVLCFVFALKNAKPLEAFLAGDVMAKTLGVDVDKIRFQIIIFTGLTVGVLTAFAGQLPLWIGCTSYFKTNSQNIKCSIAIDFSISNRKFIRFSLVM